MKNIIVICILAVALQICVVLLLASSVRSNTIAQLSHKVREDYAWHVVKVSGGSGLYSVDAIGSDGKVQTTTGYTCNTVEECRVHADSLNFFANDHRQLIEVIP